MQTQAEKDKSKKTERSHLGGEGPAESQVLAERDELRNTLGATATALSRLLDGNVKMPKEYRTETLRTLRQALGVLEAVRK